MELPLILDARFCRFAAPDGWVPLGVAGLAEPQAAGVRRCAAVSESWLDPRPPLPELAATVQAPFLRLHPDARVLPGRPTAVAGCDEGWLAGYRLPGGVGMLQLWVASGPLVCTLAVTAPDDECEDGEALAAAILESFEVPAASWAGSIRRVALGVPLPRPAGIPGPIALPELHVELQVPPGWVLDPVEGRACRGEAILTLCFDGLAGGDAEARFAEALARLSREEGRKVTGWDRGELPVGGAFRAVESRREQRRTWGKPDGTVRWEVFAESKGVLQMVLEAPVDALTSGDVGGLLAGLGWLPPERWRTPVRRPWLDAVLEGPWLGTAPGVFARTTAPAVAVMVADMPGEGGLASVASSTAAALLPVDEAVAVARHDLEQEEVESGDAFRLRLDTRLVDGGCESARGLWIGGERAVWMVLVRGAEEAAVEGVFATLLAGVRRPAQEVEP